jgi:hypothetical protein
MREFESSHPSQPERSLLNRGERRSCLTRGYIGNASAPLPPGRIEEQAESSQECALKAHGQQDRNKANGCYKSGAGDRLG